MNDHACSHASKLEKAIKWKQLNQFSEELIHFITFGVIITSIIFSRTCRFSSILLYLLVKCRITTRELDIIIFLSSSCGDNDYYQYLLHNCFLCFFERELSCHNTIHLKLCFEFRLSKNYC